MPNRNLSEFSKLDIEPLIAAKPAEPRDSSRLLVVDRKSGTITHKAFRDLPDLLAPSDILVLNRSRVWKAGLPAARPAGGKTELLLMKPADPGLKAWKALARKIRPGQKLVCRGGAEAQCLRREPDGSFLFEFSAALDSAYLEKNAEVPLPGYILKARKKAGFKPASGEDERRYQTVFASEPGSIAAPTAGFHFTPGLMERLKARGVKAVYVTLHIGWGTFKPVRSGDPERHVMLGEDCSLSGETADAINAAKRSGSRIVAVGTSSMRALETFAGENGLLVPGAALAELFIRPGHRFRAADAFCTNLHVPSSAPLYMTAAFAGRELLFSAYSRAVENKYRFYSYGDAMLIL
ncbi:MAG: tRNA preQ1(34) S-adenosylmethionine ribosyltransferase-isomerase QueA [Elusimicrobia bacterium]|nr:tRNA preQ1(34) S-adenosylmethionine ribosyltransferase-isomerase QueA [Elusimicrobiota bacterium]